MSSSFQGLFSLLAALLGLSIIALAIRSHSRADVLLTKTPGGHATLLASDSGSILAGCSDVAFDGLESSDGRLTPFAVTSVPTDEFQPLRAAAFDPATANFAILGLRSSSGVADMNGLKTRFWAIAIPDWFLITIVAALFWKWLRATGSHFHRQRNGLCLGCGYDLRATSSRCPECGREPGRPGCARAAETGAS